MQHSCPRGEPCDHGEVQPVPTREAAHHRPVQPVQEPLQTRRLSD